MFIFNLKRSKQVFKITFTKIHICTYKYIICPFIFCLIIGIASNKDNASTTPDYPIPFIYQLFKIKISRNLDSFIN